MKYHIHTLGCKFNQYESAFIDRLLSENGHTRVEASEADIIVVNSCAVTAEAVRKSLQMARHFLKKRPRPKLVFTGCAVHSDRKLPQFDLVIGNGEKIHIIDFIDKEGVFVDENYHLRDGLNYTLESIPNKTRAFLGVENGCNWNCAYCAIPNFRGRRIRSKPFELTIQEARKMLSCGIKEIVITGINIALYRDGEKDLKALLLSLLELKDDFRLRIGSVDPKSLLELKLVDVFKHPKMCHHVHLSIQSGSDTILRRMRRPYKVKDIVDVAKELKRVDTFFSFSVDVIVGFPSEGDVEFKETYDLLKELKVSRIHVFPFSARRGTLAYNMGERVDGSEKKNRVKVLKQLGRMLAEDFKLKTKKVEKRVLVEKVENGWAQGLDEYYIRRTFKYNGNVGEFVKLSEKVAGE